MGVTYHMLLFRIVKGRCYGGHLKEGCPVFFTIELVIGVFEDA
jgi:predicted DNA-binding protein with PD1-like motif